MKKWLIAYSAALALALTACTTEYVTTRPADVVYTRPVAPAPGYVWVSGDWVWTGGSYRWQEGRWVAPRGNRGWHSGAWVRHNNGYRWRRGHW